MDFDLVMLPGCYQSSGQHQVAFLQASCAGKLRVYQSFPEAVHASVLLGLPLTAGPVDTCTRRGCAAGSAHLMTNCCSFTGHRLCEYQAGL